MLAWFKNRLAEKRSYSSIIIQSLEAATTARVTNAASSAAVECVGGLLARSLSSARVDAPDWVKRSLTPAYMGQVGRELIRCGQNLSLIRVGLDGVVHLDPAHSWSWRGGPFEENWRCLATYTGPNITETREVERGGVVFIQWARLADEPHRGRGPVSLASLAARAAAEAEKSLGDESSGPVSQFLTVPDGHGGDDAEFGGLRDEIAKARGKALLVETTQGGYADRGGAPARDWIAARLGPNPPESLVMLARDTFGRLCAACGASESLFADRDGTAMREAWRRFHLATVLPVAGMIEHELSERFETPVKFYFDMYPTDLAGRAMAFQRLVSGGMSVEKAASISGILTPEE